MMLLPLTFRPAESYHKPPRNFGANRSGGRKHAGCDLYAPVGTPVRAVADGTVLRAAPFYDGTWAIEVDHGDFVARYGEVDKALAPGIGKGAQVARGQVLGKVGRLESLSVSMLHFEMYAGTAAGPLTNGQNPPFQRRPDLLDPTDALDTASLT